MKSVARLLTCMVIVCLSDATPTHAQDDSTPTPTPSSELSGTISAMQQVSVAPRTEGILSQLMVGVGSQVQKDDTLAVLDPGTILGQIAQARAGVISTRAQLQQIEQGARPEDIAAGQAQVSAAQATLKVLNAGPLPTDVQQAQDQVEADQAALAEAQTPGAQTDLAEQQAVIGQLTDTLQGTAQPYTDADVQAAEASLASAQSTMAVAVETLDETIVVAPFAGVVGSLLQEVGTDVTSSTPILTLNGTDVELDVTVAQEDVGQVAVGRPADSTSHTFDVRLVSDVQDPRLLPGMSAQVDLTGV